MVTITYKNGVINKIFLDSDEIVEILKQLDKEIPQNFNE
jgi:hypothetical protein